MRICSIFLIGSRRPFWGETVERRREERVRHFPQAQSVRWRQLAGMAAIAGPQNPSHIACSLSAETHVGHRTYQGPDHLLAERRGLHLELQKAAAEIPPGGVAYHPDQAAV